MKTILLLTLLTFRLFAAPYPSSELAASFKQTLSELVAADTSNPPGNEARVVEIVAKKLKSAGIPFEITEFAPNRKNIVARLKGSGNEAPLMLLSHIDVVPTTNQNWTVPKHELTEKEGYYYGRGVGDDLGDTTMHLEEFLYLKKSEQLLRRDIILALTGDEESGGAGIEYLLKHAPESVRAGITLNEGGGPSLDSNGKMEFFTLQVAEKTYQDFELIAEGTTGHSSIPLKDNAIYRLSNALQRLEKSVPSYRLLPVTRAYFKQRAPLEGGALGKAMLKLSESKGALSPILLKEMEKHPSIIAYLQTTCVATMLSGGTKENALPPSARAVLNCRILPDESPEDVQKHLEKIINDKKIKLRPLEKELSAPASPVEGELVTALKKVMATRYPGVPLVPFLSLSATDSRFLRVAGMVSYGLESFAMSEEDARRAHGIDERIPIASIQPGFEFLHALLLELAGK